MPTLSPRAVLACARSAALTAGLLFALVGHAEDIDIYSPHPDSDFRPKMMIGLDSSASMRFTGDAWAKWRADRLKEPIIDFLRTSDGIDVGLSSFNGVDRGGAILAPARGLDMDLCPDDACGEITVRNQIARESDDGLEVISNGGMALTNAGMSLGGRIDELASQGRYLDVGGQSFLQTESGLFETEVLPMSVTETGETATIGLHFPYITLPSNAEVTSVRVTFEWAGQEWLNTAAGEGSGIARTRIRVDARKQSPEFADSDGQRVNDRPLVPTFTEWNVRRPTNWQGLTDGATTINTPDFKDEFLQVFDKGDKGPLTVIIEPAPDASLAPEDTIALLGNHSRGSEYPVPRFVIGYRLVGFKGVPYINGYRFDAVNVPPGATVTDAWMEFLPRGRGGETEESFLQFRGEDVDDATDFGTVRRTFSDRSKTAAQVNWSPPVWSGVRTRQRTTDLAPIVQEIVDREGWCAGSAMAMFVQGSGERFTWAYRSGPYRAASLHVSYDPASVDRSRNCTTLTGADVLLLRSEGDAVQSADGRTSLDEVVFDQERPPGGSAPAMGLRFPSVNLDRGERIGEARLVLTSARKATGTAVYDVTVDEDADAGPYDTATPVGDRFVGDDALRFTQVPNAEGTRIESGDLTTLLQAIVDRPDWERGSPVSLMVQRVGGTSASFKTSLTSNGEGPQLRITRQVRGQAAARVPFRTVRDEMIEDIQTLPAVGNTPLVNLYEETARYLLGEDVVHGRRRGEQAADNIVHRLSDPRSYTGGSVERPTGCLADDPGSEACVEERVVGSPVYAAPEASECKANQIILVTDGSPTPSPSEASSAPAIRALTGQGSCASGSPAEACAVELATWLERGADGRPPITTTTIGFDFSSSFLEDVSDAGGGDSYSVTSAGQVSEALRRISARILHDSTTFVSPAAAISQFGRANHRDAVFLSQFKPAVGSALWRGNVKRYRLGPDPTTGEPVLLDADGSVVMTDGDAISPTARSFWSGTPDGAEVEKGGVASQLYLGRKLLTHPARSDGSNHGSRTLVPFESGNDAIAAADLGVTEEQREEAIDWMRGRDTRDEDGDGLVAEARKTLGAAIHTTPQLLDYAAGGVVSRSILFAGTQEGYLHAFDADTGAELFGFLPRELYDNVGPFFDTGSSAVRHGLDGPVTAWMSDENGNGLVDDGEKAFVTVGMRRGGSHYYTLDVSDPAAPSLLWTIDPSREGFEDLGQTWSRAQPSSIRVGSGEALATREVLIFANGYRALNDAAVRSVVLGERDRGAIYVVDAATGALIHRIDGADHPEMRYSMPADLVVADLDFDGIADLIVGADLGGNVWRVDLGVTRDDAAALASTRPVLTLAARLADRPGQWMDSAASASLSGDRRFFHAPDVALLKFDDGAVRLGIAIGSGRRDSPLESATVNRLYMLYLDPASPGTEALAEHDLQDATTTDATIASHDPGWFIDLPLAGEKVLGTPLIIDNRVVATSFVPPTSNDDPCKPDLGSGRLYVIDAFTGGAVPEEDQGSSDESDGPDAGRVEPLLGAGIPPPVAAYISEHAPDKPVLLVGTSGVRGATTTPAKRKTYWAEQ